MWEQLTSTRVNGKLVIGKVIAVNPLDPRDQYQIMSIYSGLVKGMHCNGKLSIITFSVEDLISGKWWIKDL